MTLVASRTGSSAARVAVCLIRSSRLSLKWAGRIIAAAICIAVVAVIPTCNKKSQATPEVTLTIIDQSWVDKPSQAVLGEELNLFTQKTGIHVQIMPAPEVAVDQLATWRSLLESGAKVPDVYGVDGIWPALLADHLIDLRVYVPEQHRKWQACRFALHVERRHSFLPCRSAAQVRLQRPTENMGRA